MVDQLCAKRQSACMRPSAIIFSETEAAHRLEKLNGLAWQGQEIFIKADNGQLIMLEPVEDDKAASAA